MNPLLPKAAVHEDPAATILECVVPHVRSVHPYVPGDQPSGGGWVKLNTNELPYPCSPRVGPAIAAEVGSLAKYPDPASRPLRAALARHHGVGADQVIVGNGSDDILNLLVRVFSPEREGTWMTFPGYSLYPTLVAIRGSRIDHVPFPEDMRLPVEALLAADPALLFLTTPNAPTGVGFENEEIRALLEGTRGIVVADEAYADFANGSAIALLAAYPRLVITRTFSKSFGLAGLRVGYALAHPEVIGYLDRVRDSYNVNRLSQAGALAALEDTAYYADVVGRVKSTRDRFAHSLSERGWFTYPSATNFVFTRPATTSGTTGAGVARSLFEHLRNDRILVRYFPSHPFTEAFLRISIGTDEDMAVVEKSIQRWTPPPAE
jgi:histidinol-phosphate aminotransferase